MRIKRIVAAVAVAGVLGVSFAMDAATAGGLGRRCFEDSVAVRVVGRWDDEASRTMPVSNGGTWCVAVDDLYRLGGNR